MQLFNPSPVKNPTGSSPDTTPPDSSSGPSLAGIGSGVGAGLGIYEDLQRGGTVSDLHAATSAGKVASQFNAFGSNSGSINTGLSELQEGYSIYKGIQSGKPIGYANAAVNAGRLGSQLGAFGGASGAIGAVAGYAAVPLALYNFAANWQSGKTGSDALNGAEAGAAIGSVIPGVGTLIGAGVGAIIGAASSAFGPGAKDPEGATFDAYSSAFAKGGPQAVAAATPSQTFQSLAGLFDLRSGQIGPNVPMYNQYGRMGEAKFTTDMMGQVNQAFKGGQITSADTPQSIYQKIVQPWINSFGKGNLSQDPHGAAIGNMMTQLIGQYMGGKLTAQTPVGVSGQLLTGLQPYAGNLAGANPSGMSSMGGSASGPAPLTNAAPADPHQGMTLTSSGWYASNPLGGLQSSNPMRGYSG